MNTASLQSNLSEYTLRILGWCVAVLVAVVPFLSFFIITIGSYGFSQGLLIAAALVWLVYVVSSKTALIRLDRTNLLFLLIMVISLAVTVFVRPETNAVIFGIKNNILPLVIFFTAQANFKAQSLVRSKLAWLVIVPGLLVSIIAILQSFVIPISFLERIGYNSSTIDPRQIVDGSLGLYRAFSTLGGPNQLGAYLLVPLAFSIVYGIKKRNGWFIGSVPFILSGIFLSYSRSAWLSAIAVVLIAVFLVLKKKQKLYFLVASLLLLIMASLSTFYLATNNQRFQNVVLHGSYLNNQILGSDQQRIAAQKQALSNIIKEPFGHGLGSAGPASYQSSKPLITENWYLQIAYEIGVVGLLLYILAFLSLLADFYRHRNQALASSLLAATIGILIANVFLHTWADGTLSLLGFTLYGLFKGLRE